MTTKLKTILILGFIIAAGAVALYLSGALKEPPRPNVIFITLDAARADRFSVYGYPQPTTPAMESFSKQGAVFLKHFSNATRTMESVPQMLSSRYFSMPLFEQDAWQWGARQLNRDTLFQQLDREQILLPEVMSGNGYRTVIIHDHAYFVPPTVLASAFDDYLSPLYQRGPGDTFAMLFDWLEKNREKQFFVYMHRMSPHEPYLRKAEERFFLGDYEERHIEQTRKRLAQRKTSFTTGWTEDEINILQGLYNSNLLHEDTKMGHLFAKLEELGLAENTLVVITSDHGENLGQHGNLGHGGPPWDSVTHIPLIMHWPAGIPSGLRIDALTENVDLMPTILDLCGLSLPEGKSADGKSLAPLLKGSAPVKEEVVYPKGARDFPAGIRTNSRKYFIGDTGYYDLDNDPGETSGIGDIDTQESLRKRFYDIMRPFKKRSEASRRTRAPDYAFILGIDTFEVSPGDAAEVKEGDRGSNEHVVRTLSPKKSWLLSTNWATPRLFNLPSNGTPPPLTLSSDLPNGSYNVHALIEGPIDKFRSLEQIGFRSRFFGTGPFENAARLRYTGRGMNAYLELGDVIVQNEKFALEIEWQPPDESIYVIHHIRFDPHGQESAIRNDDENRERQIKRLRELGYL